MLKKIISIVTFIVLVSNNTVLALNTNVQIGNTSLGKTTINLNGSFLNDLGNKNFKINFQDITANNAGRIMRTWSGKTNFPNKFVLENGFNLEINSLELDKLFVRTNDLKTKISQARIARQDIGTINLKEPTLVLLPDRVQITTETEIIFKTDAQLSNIKSKLGVGLSQEKLAEIDSTISNFSTNKPISNTKIKLNNTIIKGVDPSIQKVNMDVDKAMLAGLILDCQKTKGAKNASCTKESINSDLKNLDKSIVTTETQEFSLLPPNTIIGLIGVNRIKPADVRLTRNQILGVYAKYGTFIMVQSGTGSNNEGDRPQLRNDQNPYEQADYCTIVSGGNAQKKTQCDNLLRDKNNAQAKTYRQNLLNGFTLGESDNYHWDDSVRLHYFIGKKKLASASIDFSYNYGFGIRIPIQSEIKIDKSIVDDWGDNSKFDIYTKVNTLDAGPAYYTGVGLEESKVFNGKEFVFELGASLDVSVRVIGDLIDIDEHIPLVSMLASIMKDTGRSFFDLTGEELNDVIANNGFNKSKDFTPPFAGGNNVNLFTGSVEVPVYEIPSLLKLIVSLITEVNLNGIIKSKLNKVNSTECKLDGSNNACPENIEYNTTEFKKYNAKAVFNTNDYKENALGQYSNYGVELNNFKYIPEIIFDIFVKGTASIKLPYFGWESYSTPKIKVYTFKFSSDEIALGTHEGTIGTASAKENIVYATNPVVNLEIPNLTTMGDNDRATFELTNNKSNMIKMYYTLDGSEPNCTNNGDLYTGNKTKIWKTPYNDIVNNKNITIKALACSNYGDKTTVSTRSINLRNDSFKFSFSPKINNNRPSIKTNERIEILDSDYLNNLTVRYKLDGTIPTCNDGLVYNTATGLTLTTLGRDTLHNDFVATVRGIACNGAGRSLNQIMLENYQVHNVYYNPRIGDGLTINVTYNSYPNDIYSTFKTVTIDGTDPVCRVNLNNPGTINYADNNGLSVNMNTTIKARTCIKAVASNVISFSSDVVTRPPVGDRFNRADYSGIKERMEGKVDAGILEGFPGFEGGGLKEEILGGLAGGGFGPDTFEGMIDLLGKGDISQFGILELGGLYEGLANNTLNKAGFSNGVKALISSNDLSANGLKSIGTLISSNRMKTQELVGFSNTIKNTFKVNNMLPNRGIGNNFMRNTPSVQNNTPNANQYQSMNYILASTGTTQTGGTNSGEVNISDGLQRKFAETKIAGCRDNDIVIGEKVWASCNSIQETQYSYTNPRGTDINGWNLGAYYGNNSASCPTGYRIPTMSDFTGSINSIQGIDYLRLPASGYYSIRNGVYTLVNSKGIYYGKNQYGQLKEFIFIPGGAGAGIRLEEQDYYPDNAISLRCIRELPATNVELGINTGSAANQSSNSGTITAPIPTNTYNSNDEYVNEKLNEINSCFIEGYNSQLANINSSIEKLLIEKNKQTSITAKDKYDKAIGKLEEIKKIFILRYKSILDNNIIH